MVFAAPKSTPVEWPANAVMASAGSVISRYIFQHTQSNRMPPASVSPTMVSNCVAIAANRMRSTTAPLIPHKITRARIEGCTRDAAIPTTMALSPASTKSITMICDRAMSCWVRSTRSSTNVSEWERPPRRAVGKPRRRPDQAASGAATGTGHQTHHLFRFDGGRDDNADNGEDTGRVPVGKLSVRQGTLPRNHRHGSGQDEERKAETRQQGVVGHCVTKHGAGREHRRQRAGQDELGADRRFARPRT